MLRRVVGKTVSWVLKDDVQRAGGPLQAATGSEAAIQCMREPFGLEETDAVILVDATNAFNRLNRAVALHNIRILEPALTTILINTYRNHHDYL